MAVFGNIGTTLSGLAKTATGDVRAFRNVLNVSPALIPFKYPPQVDAGIQALKKLGVNIPTVTEIEADVLKPIQNAINGLDRKQLDGVLTNVQKDIDAASSILTSIQWLF